MTPTTPRLTGVSLAAYRCKSGALLIKKDTETYRGLEYKNTPSPPSVSGSDHAPLKPLSNLQPMVLPRLRTRGSWEVLTDYQMTLLLTHELRAVALQDGAQTEAVRQAVQGWRVGMDATAALTAVASGTALGGGLQILLARYGMRSTNTPASGPMSYLEGA